MPILWTQKLLLASRHWGNFWHVWIVFMSDINRNKFTHHFRKDMRKLTFALAIASILSGSALASAQDSQAPCMLQKASVFYDLTTLYPSGASSTNFNGFGLGYNIDFRVSKSLPLYVGTGLNARFLFYEKNLHHEIFDKAINREADVTFINLNVPVNLSYRVPVAPGFYMIPEVGLDFRVQLYGNANIHTEINDVIPGVDMSIYPQGTEGINLFSAEEMESDRMHRFQMGWHAGLNFEYNRFTFGATYGTDFVKLHKGLGAGHLLVSVGYTF